MKQTYSCIKPSCGATYESDELDPYLCPKCFEEKRVLADTIDKKFAHLYKETPKSEYAEFIENATKLKKADGTFIYFMKG